MTKSDMEMMLAAVEEKMAGAFASLHAKMDAMHDKLAAMESLPAVAPVAPMEPAEPTEETHAAT